MPVDISGPLTDSAQGVFAGESGLPAELMHAGEGSQGGRAVEAQASRVRSALPRLQRACEVGEYLFRDLPDCQEVPGCLRQACHIRNTPAIRIVQPSAIAY